MSGLEIKMEQPCGQHKTSSLFSEFSVLNCNKPNKDDHSNTYREKHPTQKVTL